MCATYRITVLPGDGIGPEVVHATIELLGRLAAGTGDLRLEFNEHAVGAGEFLRSGEPLPSTALQACVEADAVLLGAMGLPSVRWPDGRELAPQLDLREQLDLYGGLRPVELFHEADTPLKKHQAGGIDLLLVRENTEGLFFSRTRSRESDDHVDDTLRITRRGSERIFRLAFEEARKRRRHVTLVDKANVLPSMVFFRQIFEEVASQYPDVQADVVYIDAMALYLVRNPERFDVIVTENMFGDILSDLVAGIVGGMGFAPSGDIGDSSAVFQPSHGSAPDIAGQGIANPVATILSGAMMLEWLGSTEATEAAHRLRQAVRAVLADPSRRTPDVGGTETTESLTRLIAERL